MIGRETRVLLRHYLEQGLSKAGMGGHSAHDELVLAGSPCGRRNAAHAPQRLVVPARQRLGGLGEQRGDDGLADSGQGGEDRHIALPDGLAGAGVLAIGQYIDQAGELPLGLGELAVYEAEVFEDASDVGDRGLGGSGCDGDGRGAKDVEELVGGDPPDPAALEKALKGPALDAPGLRGRRHLGPEVEGPGLDYASDRIEDLRIVAPQLLPHAVRQARALPE